jgi:hypothetical protein
MIEAKHRGPQRNENAVVTGGDHPSVPPWAGLRSATHRCAPGRSAPPSPRREAEGSPGDWLKGRTLEAEGYKG